MHTLDKHREIKENKPNVYRTKTKKINLFPFFYRIWKSNALSISFFRLYCQVFFSIFGTIYAKMPQDITKSKVNICDCSMKCEENGIPIQILVFRVDIDKSLIFQCWFGQRFRCCDARREENKRRKYATNNNKLFSHHQQLFRIVIIRLHTIELIIIFWNVSIIEGSGYWTNFEFYDMYFVGSLSLVHSLYFFLPALSIALPTLFFLPFSSSLFDFPSPSLFCFLPLFLIHTSPSISVLRM